MADDIDIEEHDVLESLRRRQMPDAVVVKTEPQDVEDTEPRNDSTPKGYIPSQWDWNSETTPQIKIEIPTEEDFQFGKIILGSKPMTSPVNKQVNPPEEKEHENFAEENSHEDYNYNMSLVLDDWGPILEKSNCYCSQCEILFATVNALDAHNMIAHSFLVPTDKEASPERNKAIKSTAKLSFSHATCEICKSHFKGTSGKSNLFRHYRQVHQIDACKLESTQELKNWKVCNHCNVYFPSDTALVKHLYELLPLSDSKTPTKDEKRTPVKVQNAVKATITTDAKRNLVKVQNAVKATITNDDKISLGKVQNPVNITKTNDDKRIPGIVQSAVEDTTILYDYLRVTPSTAVKTYKRTVQPVLKVATIPTSSKNNVKSNNGKSSLVGKDVKFINSIVTKETNTVVLGSKVNNVKFSNIKTEHDDSTPKTEKKCEICGIEYSSKYYLKHMKKFHADFLLLKMKKLKKIQQKVNVRFKCTLCNIILNGKVKASEHRIKKHPHMRRRKILITVFNKTQKVKAKPKDTEVSEVEEKADIVVSKSTLFKCNRCSVHFLTCYGACAHSRVCETSSNMRDWSCPQCQRVFKNTDKKAHELQHETISTKFKVYVVYLEMVVRILCECPFCYVCFEEYKFWRHVNFGCERDTQSFYCNECRLPIDASSRVNHESKHTQGDFTKEDFIKIDFISYKKELGMDVEHKIKTESVTPKKEISIRALKRKMEEPEAEAKKTKLNGRDEFYLYYCTACKCYMSIKASFHVQGKCKELLIKNNKKMCKVIRKSACKICAISFTTKTSVAHKKLHEKYPNLTLSDLVFTRLSDDKKIKPVIENFPCKKCRITFCSKMSKYQHVCGETKSVNCQVCEKKIDKQSFKMHMRFHNYVIPGKGKPIPQKNLQNTSKSSTNPNLKLVEAKPLAQKLPELLMKYKSLTTLWNILYLCETCDTFTDSYDKVVEHSQNHFTNMESYGVVIMKCQICNMKFDRECYRRHLHLHAGSKVITRKSFKVLKYDHSKLFSSHWLNFIDLPDDQKSQIVTRSIYGETRRVRMRLVQQGPPENTVYRCAQCLKCVKPDSLSYHINLIKCSKANKIDCSYCSLTFVNRSTCDEHEKIHQDSDLGADSFRIVAFNDLNDGEFSNKLTTELTESNDIEVVAPSDASDFEADNVKLIKSKKFYMFYKCGDCGVSSRHKNNAQRHFCSNSAKKTCPKCGLVFAQNYLSLHNILHEKFNFSRKNIFTKTFYNNDDHSKSNDINSRNIKTVDTLKVNTENMKEEAKLYRCHCGLHYTSLKTIEKHYQAKNCGSVVRENCSQCNLIFDPTEVVNHLCKHHARSRFKHFDIITPNKKTLYKCNQCHLLFYDKQIAGTHKQKCKGIYSGTKCENCGLAFHETSIETHREDHKNSGRLKPDCYIVLNIPNDKPDNNVLYKCDKCDVHFMLRSTARNHVVEYNHKLSTIQTCKECGRRFPTKTLVKHVAYHHDLLKIVDFDIRHSYKVPKFDDLMNRNKNTATINELEINKRQEVTAVKESEIFKCKKCSLKFTDENTLVNHNEDRCSKELTEVCDICDMKFAARNIKEHQKQHGADGRFNASVCADDEEINEDNDNPQDIYCDKKLYRCRNCDLHFNLRKTAQGHIISGCVSKWRPEKCEECDLPFTKHSLARHKIIHQTFNLKKKDFEIINLPCLKSNSIDKVEITDEIQSRKEVNNDTASLDSSLEQQPTDTSNTAKAKIKLYKCGDCNVYFVGQSACYKHTNKHSALDPKDYIECKLCGFQFTIVALQTHIKKHHAKQFNLDEVLVEEYQPNDLKNNVPKIEIYYAIDKDQSRLVSTSSDVKDTSKVVEALDQVENGYSEGSLVADDNDSSEITSNCNELTEKNDSKQNVTQIDIIQDVDVICLDDDVMEIPIKVENLE